VDQAMAQLDGVIAVMSEIRDLLASWDNDLAWLSWRIRRQPWPKSIG
jgi:hypothetical protein